MRDFVSLSYLVSSICLLGCADGRPRDGRPRLANRAEIAKRLPGDLKLEIRIPEINENGNGRPRMVSYPSGTDKRKTVEETLLEAGAHIDEAGRFVDMQNRLIVFRKKIIEGTPPASIPFSKDPDEGKRVIIYHIDCMQ